jgi:hypothetical protein
MAEGQVTGLPWEYILGQTPFVTEIYATPADSDEDNLGLISVLKPWLLELLKGPAVHFRMLLKYVKTHERWGMVGEVLWYRQLKHHSSDLHLHIEHLDAKLQGVRQAQMTSWGCLEMAHLERSAYDLQALTTKVGICSAPFAFPSWGITPGHAHVSPPVHVATWPGAGPGRTAGWPPCTRGADRGRAVGGLGGVSGGAVTPIRDWARLGPKLVQCVCIVMTLSRSLLPAAPTRTTATAAAAAAANDNADSAHWRHFCPEEGERVRE